MGIQIRSASKFMVTFYGRNLKLLNPDLFQRVATQSGDALDGHVSIDANKLDAETKEQLMAAMVLMGKMPAPGSMSENEAFNQAQLEAGKRDAAVNLQRMTNEREGQAQLRAYYAAGLEDCKENADLITNWITENAKGIFAKASVIGAVENQRGRLRWKKIEPVAPVAAPTEPAELLPNGEHRLRLNAGEHEMRRASVTQLRDLAKRRGEGQSRPGAFGTRL